ncbi:MAG: choice-of-anchor J domain-containing protein, partial [Muribaculaceae bacterium]|nr:choice-of-anchor J domain-containing protein [Muribaculaceae bacterium]
MKKKVFSLMMMLLLAFTGFVRADELTVNDGTAYSGYLPIYGLYVDTQGCNAEYVIPAADLTAMNGGEISGLTYYLNTPASAAWTGTIQVYMTEVEETTVSGLVGPDDCTLVYTGTLDASGSTMEVTFDDNYTYNGGNLLIGMYVSVAGNYKSAYFYGVDADAAGYLHYGSSSYQNLVVNFMPKTTFAYTPGEGGDEPDEPGEPTFEDNLHVKYVNAEGEEVIDTLDLGVRPAGAWMEPFTFTMYTDGPDYTVTVLDFTPSDGMFVVEGEELPFDVVADADVELTMGTNSTAAGIIERQFVAITEGDRAAHIWPVRVELYTPECPDVVEVAYELNEGEPLEAGFSYEGIPSEITPTELHNDYTLPFPEIPEGVDGVYKFTVENDVILNAWVDTTAENGKVALYKQEGEELPHPMADNYYQGLNGGEGGSAATPFEAQIGEGTTTTGYFPFYTLYNYSIAENLFTAAELEGAGVTTAPMTSLSWYATNAPGYEQQGITIWMANVADETLTTTSHPVTSMTKVYTGAMTPAVGWNEFVFNEGNFAWDGTSNVLIYCQRNNGSWNSTVNWQATASLPFNAMAYRYQDSEAYDATVANPMYTSTTRPNIIMKSTGRNRDAITYDFEDGLDGWTVIDVNEDEGTWVHSDDNPGLYDYTTLAHGGTGFAMCYSFVDYVAAYNTNSYLVSPQKYAVDNNSTITFWADNANDEYPESFSVCVATAAQPTAADFTEVWSGAAKGNGPAGKSVRHMNNRYEN